MDEVWKEVYCSAEEYQMSARRAKKQNGLEHQREFLLSFPCSLHMARHGWRQEKPGSYWVAPIILD
jgi:hypothetical protein